MAKEPEFDMSFSETVEVDDLIETTRATKKKNRRNDGLSSIAASDSGSDEERQSLLLSVNHDNKALRACVISLQEQVARLEEAQGLPPTSISNIPPVPLIARGSGRSVAFGDGSDGEDSSNSGGNNAKQPRQGQSVSTGQGSRRRNNKGGSRYKPVSRTRSNGSNSHASSRTGGMGTRQQGSGPLQAVPIPTTLTTSQTSSSYLGDDTLDQHLGEDTYAFLIATRYCSKPFILAIFVFLFQMAIYVLMATNLLDTDNPDNPFGIPPNVTDAVWTAQIIALVISVIMQDDLRSGFDMAREGYSETMDDAFIHATRWKWAMSVAARCIGGSFGLMVNFLLVVTSETVIDLLLNFTALAFVSQLDEAAFFLAKQGFAGRKCLEHANHISTTHYAVHKRMVQATKGILMVIILVVMLIAWGFTRHNQTSGFYLCKTLLVQFGDDLRPELGTFAGLYDLQYPSGLRLQSQHVQYIERLSGHARFAFCETNSYWTVQWKDSPEGSFPASPCDGWYVRSSQTASFDITQAANDVWFVRDALQRELILEPFFLHCYECGNTLSAKSTSQCTGRGTCSNAVCTCDEGWFGFRCEFITPCPALDFDARTSFDLGIPGFRPHEELDDGLQILTDDQSSIPVQAYSRPIYIGHLLTGHHMVIFFSGRRWVATHTGLLPSLNRTHLLLGKEAGREEILGFFTNNSFHAHWSNFAVEYLSEPMDLGTPSSQNSPESFGWYEAEAKTAITQVEIQGVNEGRPFDTRLICATCDGEFNPCFFDGVCLNSTCVCAIGAHGTRCEKSPVNNGRCDSNYNIPYFELDGGDCCSATCISSADYTCGEDLKGYVNHGYFHCDLPSGRWQILDRARIDGDPLSLTGYSVALSQSGTLLAVGEPEQSRVKIFDKDGAQWILRESLQGPPDSHFGVSVKVSGGPVHWRNNPNFRAPLILAVGVEESMHVEIFKCGNKNQCTLVDQLDNVHGKVGPEAYDISNDGRVLAFGHANTGRVEVFETSGDYYEGNRTLRQTIIPVEDQLQSAVYGIRLSHNGDVLAVSESLSPPRMNIVRVFEWDGESYEPRGDPLFESNGDILQRQLAMSANGNVVAIGQSECPKLNLPVFEWDAALFAWRARPSPSLPEESCPNTYLEWSLALDQDGRSLFAGAYPDSDLITAYEWESTTWKTLGAPITAPLPGSHSAIAVSSNGAHIVVGLPYAGANEAGAASTYSLPLSHCPTDSTHHFRLSLTTDYEPENTLWSLEDAESGEIIMTEGPYVFSLATLVEELCLSTSNCHAFTIYNTNGHEGLERPGRYDLFLDGEDLDRESFSGHAKRVFFGDTCLTCSNGTRMLRMMVHTCQQAQWMLLDDTGSSVATGTSLPDAPCGAIENYYWEETCIEEAICYNFTTAVTTEGVNSSNPGLDYLLLYDDDVQITAKNSILSSSSSQVGNCPGLVIDADLDQERDSFTR